MNATATEIPTEILRPGRAIQRLNVWTPEGEFSHQVRFPGTVEEAYEYVAWLTNRTRDDD
ncbi:hypothetical protein ACFXJ8_11820 [Nonomuraea sp. NPDC059194]|uniref:hypothetical protein n=1 Tax=Nonomuraea sp. NPDC059194 TaxID=3346764 RepID=UPI00368493FC